MNEATTQAPAPPQAQAGGPVDANGIPFREPNRPKREAPPPALLLDARAAASMCGVSRSTFWALHSAGKVPMPVHLGRRTLWRTSELAAWTEAGCPPRDRWQATRGARP
jgi:predicted DNA-binding transcriptional regulator AlpA